MFKKFQKKKNSKNSAGCRTKLKKYITFSVNSLFSSEYKIQINNVCLKISISISTTSSEIRKMEKKEQPITYNKLSQDD